MERGGVQADARESCSGTIVIADDDSDCHNHLLAAFKAGEAAAAGFADGREAWDAIQQTPDVVLVVANWMLPGLDGHIICSRLVKQRPEVSTVLMLGRGILPSVWFELQLQADYILAKPFAESSSAAQARRLVEIACRRRQGLYSPEIDDGFTRDARRGGHHDFPPLLQW